MWVLYCVQVVAACLYVHFGMLLLIIIMGLELVIIYAIYNPNVGLDYYILLIELADDY